MFPGNSPPPPERSRYELHNTFFSSRLKQTKKKKRNLLSENGCSCTVGGEKDGGIRVCVCARVCERHSWWLAFPHTYSKMSLGFSVLEMLHLLINMTALQHTGCVKYYAKGYRIQTQARGRGSRDTDTVSEMVRISIRSFSGAEEIITVFILCVHCET